MCKIDSPIGDAKRFGNIVMIVFFRERVCVFAICAALSFGAGRAFAEDVTAISPEADEETESSEPSRSEDLSADEARRLRELLWRDELAGRLYEESRANYKKNRIPIDRFLLTVDYDNDIFIHNASGGDRGYTNGMRIAGLKPVDTAKGSLLHRWRDEEANSFLSNILRLYDTNEAEAQPFFGAVIGQEIFTPSNLGAEDAVEWDQPYAGWLYVGALFQLNGEYGSLNAEFDIGGTGDLSLAEPVHRSVHEAVGAKIPRGWKNQVSTGVGSNFYLKFDRLIFNVPSRAAQGVPVQFIDMRFDSESALGAFKTSQGIGLVTRFGYIKQHWGFAIHENQFVPDRRIPPRFRQWGTDLSQCYLLVRLKTDLVLWNAALQGLPFRENSHTISIQPLVQEGEAGIVVQPVNLAEITVSVTHRSQETRAGRGDRGGHSWGHIRLALHWY